MQDSLYWMLARKQSESQRGSRTKQSEAALSYEAAPYLRLSFRHLGLNHRLLLFCGFD